MNTNDGWMTSASPVVYLTSESTSKLFETSIRNHFWIWREYIRTTVFVDLSISPVQGPNLGRLGFTSSWTIRIDYHWHVLWFPKKVSRPNSCFVSKRTRGAPNHGVFVYFFHSKTRISEGFPQVERYPKQTKGSAERETLQPDTLL